MDPFSALAGAVLNIGTTAGGQFVSEYDDDQADRWEDLAVGELRRTRAPTLQELQARQAGSTLGGMQSDFGNTGARNAAIQALMNEGLAGGNTLETQLAQANAQRAAGQASRQTSQAALQSAASRGTGGGAATLQAQLLGGSQGADRAAQVGLQGAADARRNALQALAQGGAMAGQAEQADGGRELARRQSLDAMSRFNTEQAASTDRLNAGLRQQNFDNEILASDRRAAGLNTYAQRHRNNAERTRRGWAAAGQALGQTGGAMGSYGGGGK